MTRRLERFSPKDNLDVRLKPHLNKEIDIIGLDHRITHVVLSKVDRDYLYGINLRGKKVKFPVNKIREVILHT
jgi:hypothetical protein